MPFLTFIIDVTTISRKQHKPFVDCESERVLRILLADTPDSTSVNKGDFVGRSTRIRHVNGLRSDDVYVLSK